MVFVWLILDCYIEDDGAMKSETFSCLNETGMLVTFENILKDPDVKSLKAKVSLQLKVNWQIILFGTYVNLQVMLCIRNMKCRL